MESIRVLRVTRRGAVMALTQTINQLKALLLTAPAGLREDLRRRSTPAVVDACASLQSSARLHDPAAAVIVALRRLALRYHS